MPEPGGSKLNIYGGMHNRAPETALPDGFVRRAVNIDFTAGGLRRRVGQTRVYTGSVHSLFSSGDVALFVEGGTLKRLSDTYSASTVKAGVGDYPMSYAELNGEIVFANIGTIGRVDAAGVARDNGVESPTGQPILQAIAAGGLDAGTYQVVQTYVSSTGEEGGSTLAAQVDVAEGGGISLTAIRQPVGSNVSQIAIYMSRANSAQLYRAVTLAAGATSTVLGKMVLGRILDTQFLSPMPSGHIVRVLNGRLYVAQDNFIIGSEPLRFGLTKLSSNIIPLASRVVMMEPCGDGMYVSDESNLYFLGGADLSQFRLSPRMGPAAFEGSGIRVDAQWFGQSAGEAVAWLSTEGHMLGAGDGSITALTKDRLAVPFMSAATPLLREARGIRQLIHSARGTGTLTSSANATDSVVTEVIRNGVLVA